MSKNCCGSHQISNSPIEQTSFYSKFTPMTHNLKHKTVEIEVELSKIHVDNKSAPIFAGHTYVGSIRINPKCFSDAYITAPDGGADIFIEGIIARAAALDGDRVKVQINHESQWKISQATISNHWHKWCHDLMPIIDTFSVETTNSSLQNESGVKRRVRRHISNDKSKVPPNLPEAISQLKLQHIKDLPFAAQCIQKTAYVVEIVEKRHNRIAGGFIELFSKQCALFKPTDHRLPRMLIPLEECPCDFAAAQKRYKDILFVARMQDDWDPCQKYANGTLLKIVGPGNSINSKMQILLLESDICDQDFPPEVYESLKSLDNLPANWMASEIRLRRDLQNECIFTIDPKTARDLDDAVSIKKVDNGVYELGVHIADVSYFVKELTAVDYYARLRTTSVYLVDRVIPMLPRVLCEQMCSLNPNEPKLTFSVIWKLDKNGKILDEWFGRTVIKSCVKLAYEQAQDLIDNPADISWIEEGVNMPTLHKFDWSKISRSVRRLNDIAKNLRHKRFKDGALKIEQTKLKFELDRESGLPTGFSSENRSEANFLIEEYMLLANIAVAKRIYKYDKELAFLRRHPPSDTRMLVDLEEFCKIQGCTLDPTSAGSIQKSLDKIEDRSLSKVVSHLLLRSMKNAEYICAGAFLDDSFKHFALNVPLYTHFTSPIRRYPDIIVHRLLAKSLDYISGSCEDVNSLEAMASECTKRKMSSKQVSDLSQKLYFNLFVQKAGFCELSACVLRVLDRSMDVVLFDYDRNGRVYLDALKPYLADTKYQCDDGIATLSLKWFNLDKVNLGNEHSINEGDSKKARKKKNKIIRKILELESVASDVINSRKKLETHQISGGVQPDVLIQSDKTQIIAPMKILKVYAVCDKDDICNLKFYLKTPIEEFNQDLLYRIR